MSEEWPRVMMYPETVKRDYPELWDRLRVQFEAYSDDHIANIASLVVDTCSSCYAANRSCQCWNDD